MNEQKVTADEMVEELTRTIGNLHMQIAAMQILIRKLTTGEDAPNEPAVREGRSESPDRWEEAEG